MPVAKVQDLVKHQIEVSLTLEHIKKERDQYAQSVNKLVEDAQRNLESCNRQIEVNRALNEKCVQFEVQLEKQKAER